MVKTIYTDGDYELEISSVQTETGRKIRLELRSFDWITNPAECLTIDLCPYEDIDELVDELQQKQKAILVIDELQQNQLEEDYEKQQSKKSKNK